MMRALAIIGKILAGLISLLVVLVLALFLAINLVDWNKHKNLLIKITERFTPLRIDELDGIKVQAWRSAEFSIVRLRLHREGLDASTGPFQLRVAMGPLLFKRQLLIQSVTADGVRLSIKETAAPEPKPESGDAEPVLARLPQIFINLAEITDSRLIYQSFGTKTPIGFVIDHLQVTAPLDDPTPRIHGQGEFDDLPWQIEGRTGTLENFSNADKPFSLDLKAQLGRHTAEVKGTVQFAESQGDFVVKAKGRDLEEIKKLFRLNLGTIPAYDLEFVTHLEPENISFEQMNLKLGKSSLRGSGQLDFRSRIPNLTANLESPVTVQQDWAGLFKTDERYKKANDPPKAPGQYFSDKPIDVGVLKAVNVDIKYVVKDFRGEKAGRAIHGWNATVRMKDGDLRIDPVSFAVADGRIGGRFHLDGRKQPLDVKIELGARRIDLKTLLGPLATEIPVFDLKPSDMAKGFMTGQLDLKMTGKTPMELAKSVVGPIELAVEDGELSATVIEAFGIDLTQTIASVLKGHPRYDIQCALTAFEARDGVIKSRAFLIATKDTSIIGKGQVNLVGNKVDFVLNAHPHDFSIGSLRSPIYIKGPLNDIEVGLERQELLTRSGIAVLLGTLVNPLAALAPLVEPGLDKAGKCRSVMADLQEVEKKAAKLSSREASR